MNQLEKKGNIMNKFYTYLLISCVIFASFSINPGVVTADDGIGPTIIGAGYVCNAK